MYPSDFHLIIHHHMSAYRDEADAIYLSSVLGRWINSLAPHFKQLTLLLYQTNERLSSQDTEISHSNVVLKSLGPPGRMWDRIPRMRRLRLACHELSSSVDGLLIRGLTPRQYNVWKHIDTPRKSFLLVGSIRTDQVRWLWTFRGFYAYVYHKYRPWELHRMVQQNTHLMVNSLTLVDEIQAKWGVTPSFVPTSSIQIDEFAPCLPRQLNTQRCLLFVGRVVPGKGIYELLEASAQLIHSDEVHRVDIVGPVSDSLREQILSILTSLDISRRVVMHGTVPFGSELFAFYSQADILVHPSYSEGFPHVLWEAAANSCPVITTGVGGIPKVWHDGTHGILIPPKDVNSLVVAIRRMLNDNEFRYSCVQNAYALAQQHTAEAGAQALVDTLVKVW